MSDFLGGGLRNEDGKILVEVRPHDYQPPKRRRDATGHYVIDPFCGRCGFHRLANASGAFIHPEQDPTK